MCRGRLGACRVHACRRHRPRVARRLRRVGAVRRGAARGLPRGDAPDHDPGHRGRPGDAARRQALLPAACAGCAIAPRVAPAGDAARLADAAHPRRRRARRLEQPRVRQGGPAPCRRAAPLLLPHAHALRLGLRGRAGALPVGAAAGRPPCDGVVSALGPGDGRQRRPLPRQLAGRRPEDRARVRSRRRGRPPAGQDRLLHARRRARGRLRLRRPARRLQVGGRGGRGVPRAAAPARRRGGGAGARGARGPGARERPSSPDTSTTCGCATSTAARGRSSTRRTRTSGSRWRRPRPAGRPSSRSPRAARPTSSSPARPAGSSTGATPGAFRDAIRLAAAEELDAAEISRRAQRFSAERFRREIAAAADELLQAGARR